MTRKAFYREIKNNLNNFSDSELRKILEYYDEIINDKMDLGYSEEEAIASLGDVRNITNGIKADVVYERVNDKSKKSSSVKNFWIILGVCSSPILIPLGIGFFIGFIGIIIGLITAVISIVGAAIIGVGVLIATFINIINTGASLSTLLIIGGGILFISGLFLLTIIGFIKLSKLTLNAFVRLFSKAVKKKSRKGNLEYV